MVKVPKGNSEFRDHGPCFFRIMKGQPLEQLQIPPHFIEHLKNEGAGRATLEGPFGDLWTVILHKDENGTYLQEGWPEFARHHSLGNYEFLLFRHEGNLCFRVQIFDKNGLERIGESLTCGVAMPAGKRKRGRPRKNKV